jgi:hypothetical protein
VHESNLYPEPPHLTISVYPDSSESECFAAACGVVEGIGCRPSGTVEVAPWEMEFELRSDLAGKSSLLDLQPDRFRSIITGSDRSVRPVRAGYTARGGRVVLVEYLASPHNDLHPIGVTIAAGPLGIPGKLWGRHERTSASRLVRWTLEVLQELTTRYRVAYGAVGVEYSLATPSELASDAATLPSEVFLSRTIATDFPQIKEAFARDYRDGVVIEWPSGWFFSEWEPFSSKQVSFTPRNRPANASSRLGRTLLNR